MAWIKVADVSKVQPGAGTTVLADGREFALFLVEGKYYCIDNACPHMGGPLAEGDLEGEVVYCPWHYWPINIRTGELTFDADVCTATYACKMEGESIFVEIA